MNGSTDTHPNQGRPMPFHRPIKWDKTYYSFTGFKDPEEELEQAQRIETTLRYPFLFNKCFIAGISGVSYIVKAT